MANYIRQQAVSETDQQPGALVKPILLHGKSVGKIQHKGKKLVVEINSSVLTVEKEQEIEAFFNQLMAES